MTKAAEDARELDFAVQGITCAACIGTIERAVAALSGAPTARLNYATRRLRVRWRDDAFDPASIARTLATLGYTARVFELGALEQADAEQMQYLLRCLGVAGFAAMNVMLLSVAVWAGQASGIDPATRDLFHRISALIALPAAVYAGRPFYVSAARALRRRSLNMDVPITVGVVLAIGMSLFETAHGAAHAYFDSALMLLFFLLVGRALDATMRRRTRAVAANLASLRAGEARVMKLDGALVETPSAALLPGDRILVRPGERFLADGKIVVGRTTVDESPITGETKGRAAAPGASVYAGSINLDGAVEVEVVAVGKGTLLDEIERLIENATAAKSRYLQLADRISRAYAPVVHIAALASGLAWLAAGATAHDALVVAISVLIVTCPCAVALAAPAVQVVIAGALFRRGVLINKADAIERLAEVDTVVFDKTGTLTLPELEIEADSTIPPDLREIAARLALSSRHPLAQALARQALLAAPYADVSEVAGRGVAVTVQGHPARLGALDFCGVAEAPDDNGLSRIAVRLGVRTATFRLRQALRRDAAAVVEQLARQAYAIEILSGDNSRAVRDVARALKVEKASGELKPAAKVQRLNALAAGGAKTLMVGDGINDAPALAAAHVSMSPSSASDLAQNLADIVFMGDDLAPVEAVLRASRRARAAMRQNLAIAVAYNAVALPLAALGHLTPIVAAAAMSGSSLLVTLNALRLRNAAAAIIEATPAKAIATAAFARTRSAT